MPFPLVASCLYAGLTSVRPVAVALVSLIFIGGNVATNMWLDRRPQVDPALVRRTARGRSLLMGILLTILAGLVGRGGLWWLPIAPSLMALALLLEARESVPWGLFVIASTASTYVFTTGDTEVGPAVAINVMVLAFMIPVASALRGQVDRLIGLTSELAVEASRARAASAEKSRFLAHMSHEIRTPLNGLMGSLELAKSEPDPAAAEALTRIAAEAATDLRSLLDDVLDLSKIEAGEMVVESVPTNPWHLQRRVLATFGGAARERGLELRVCVDPDVPEWGSSDPMRLRQIVFNLVGNALEFTLHGSVDVRVRRDDQGLAIVVADTGIGIPPDRLGAVFDPFRQADDSTTRRFGGTGLGLGLVRNLTQLLGGNLAVESAVDKGSTFTVRLPWRPCPAPPVQSNDELPQLGLRDLVVEDNPVNQMVSQAMLHRIGCASAVAENGVRALEMLADFTYDVVLMDCHMPEFDGVEATRLARERGDRTPIVALTASALKSERARCLAAGMDDFLSKPLDLADLTRSLSGLAAMRSRGRRAPTLEA